VPRPKTYDAALRETLIAVTAEAIARSGTEALSLRRLAGDSGTSTSAVYALFGGKAELVEAVVVAAAESFTRAQTEAVTPPGDPVADVRALGHAYREWALEHPALYLVMFGGRISVPSPSGDGDAEPPPSMVPLLSVVTRLRQAGVVRDAPVTDIARSIWAAVHGMVSLEIAEGAPLREERRTAYAEHLEVLLRGWRP
jgi:AcrR family transcriptional regulator